MKKIIFCVLTVVFASALTLAVSCDEEKPSKEDNKKISQDTSTENLNGNGKEDDNENKANEDGSREKIKGNGEESDDEWTWNY